jgi:hypothetical protein
MTAIVAIFITASKAFAKVVIVLLRSNIITTVAEVRVLIDKMLIEIESPVILPVSLSGEEAFLIAVVHGFTEQIGAISICLVVSATTKVPILPGGVEVWIIIVIALLVPEPYFLLMPALHIVPLIPALRCALLLLKLSLTFPRIALLPVQIFTILHLMLPLLFNKLLLTLL